MHLNKEPAKVERVIRIKDLETEIEQLRAALKEAQEYADKLVSHIPYLPADIENLREANTQLAADLDRLQNQLGENHECLYKRYHLDNLEEIGKLKNEVAQLLHEPNVEYNNTKEDLAHKTRMIKMACMEWAEDVKALEKCGVSMYNHNGDYHLTIAMGVEELNKKWAKKLDEEKELHEKELAELKEELEVTSINLINSNEMLADVVKRFHDYKKDFVELSKDFVDFADFTNYPGPYGATWVTGDVYSLVDKNHDVLARGTEDKMKLLSKCLNLVLSSVGDMVEGYAPFKPVKKDKPKSVDEF